MFKRLLTSQTNLSEIQDYLYLVVLNDFYVYVFLRFDNGTIILLYIGRFQ